MLCCKPFKTSLRKNKKLTHTEHFATPSQSSFSQFSTSWLTPAVNSTRGVHAIYLYIKRTLILGYVHFKEYLHIFHIICRLMNYINFSLVISWLSVAQKYNKKHQESLKSKELITNIVPASTFEWLLLNTWTSTALKMHVLTLFPGVQSTAFPRNFFSHWSWSAEHWEGL